jgi:site-specific DNA recombinase
MSEKAIAYLRVSTEGQKDSGLSLEAQGARLRAYCDSQGLELIEIITDAAVSAGKLPSLSQRPGGQRALELLERGYANNFVATKLDRAFRSAFECLKQVECWEKENIAAHFLDINVNTKTALGKMFLTIAAGFAEMEKSLISERTKAALAVKIAAGVKLGPPRYANKEVISRIISQRDQHKIPFKKIAADLNEDKIPTMYGKLWFGETVRKTYNSHK